MAASQNNLSLILNQQDSSGVNILNRLVGQIAYSGVVGQFTDGILTTTGATSQTLPTTNVLQYLIRNTSTGTTGPNITVSWTPAAATGSVIAGKIGPGGVLALWQTISGASGSISAVSLQADQANTTFEQFFGG